MAVSQVSIWSVHPGKLPDTVATAAKSKVIHERLGAKVRLRQIVYGGPNANQLVYSIEHADMAAFAAFTDKLLADADWQALVAVIFGAEAPATLLSNSVTTDVPGF